MKYLIILFLPFLTSELLAQDKKEEDFSHHSFFEERSVSVAVGLPYSNHIESLGFNTRLYYNMGEKICFGPEFSYFSHNEENIYDINFVGHYIFETKLVGIYPLMGANYTIEEKEHETEKALGFVAGGGFHRNIKKVTVFIEYAHVFSDLKDDFFSLGMMFTLK